ncbi:hypothetical protein MKLM6_4182 [Methylomonas koyamae]|nr:hypothetical protein MKLM6_4182 [Methylomonas koyamae]
MAGGNQYSCQIAACTYSNNGLAIARKRLGRYGKQKMRDMPRRDDLFNIV